MITVVKIYASWCPACIMMEDEWKKLETMLKGKSNIKVVSIEQKEEKKLKDFNKKLKMPLEIDGYPTIAKIEDGEINYYSGFRTSEPMYNWVTNESVETKKNKTKKNKTKKRTRTKSKKIKKRRTNTKK